ncbi:MAG: DNA-directed RNA polymerase subunit delta [Erysipelotrichaceae bacterium]|nr:DNA-directed RNA polymerase subunit delta [Erysipelotrichaceae bacterium]MDD4643047.1 DNA-directed RNA polymerase subunit delta [Erysipelotrichaceae bacterium]
MSSRSMTDIAYELMKKDKKEAVFSQLWQEVSKTLGLSETQTVKKIASFYSALMLDTRFTLLADNKWDLRERRRYNESHVDTSSILIDDEDEEYDEDYEEEDDSDDEKENDKEEEDEKDF